MKNDLTTIIVKNDLPLQAGNNPLSNDPAGTADIEMAKTKNPEQKPDMVTPETEKPDIQELPKTKNHPEVEETNIDEAPATEVKEIPGQQPAEKPGS